MAMETTLSIIKPDGVKRNLLGKIMTRFEEEGLEIAAAKKIWLSKREAEGFYAVHRERPFFGSLVDYIVSSPVVVMALEGTSAIQAARGTIGATNPAEAGAGTIRGDYGLEIGRNLVHGSDSAENGQIEVANFFSEDELIRGWARNTDSWIFE